MRPRFATIVARGLEGGSWEDVIERLTVSSFAMFLSSSSSASLTWTRVISFIAGGPVGCEIIHQRKVP